MSEWEIVRHQVAIAGRVTDGKTRAPIADAVVEIWRQAQNSSGLTSVSNQASDRTLSHADGLFYFVDSPPGTYRLQASAPHLGTRYGVFIKEDVIINPKSAQPGNTQKLTWVDVVLPPTCIVGKVTSKSGPVAGAQVRLRGDTRVVLTDTEGCYELTHLVASKPTIEVTAENFAQASQVVELKPGQDSIANVKLDPTT